MTNFQVISHEILKNSFEKCDFVCILTNVLSRKTKIHKETSIELCIKMLNKCYSNDFIEFYTHRPS